MNNLSTFLKVKNYGGGNRQTKRHFYHSAYFFRPILAHPKYINRIFFSELYLLVIFQPNTVEYSLIHQDYKRDDTARIISILDNMFLDNKTTEQYSFIPVRHLYYSESGEIVGHSNLLIISYKERDPGGGGGGSTRP